MDYSRLSSRCLAKATSRSVSSTFPDIYAANNSITTGAFWMMIMVYTIADICVLDIIFRQITTFLKDFTKNKSNSLELKIQDRTNFYEVVI